MLVANIFLFIMDVEYWIFLWLFDVVPMDCQWILAPILPLCREVNATLLNKICLKIVASKDESVELLVSNIGN